jgi:hypothetical protein
MRTLNPYKITWLVLTPVKGIATKKDHSIANKAFYGFMNRNNGQEIVRHFATKENALKALESLKLSKEYKATFITDAQFGLSKWDESLLNVATKLQLQNQILI